MKFFLLLLIGLFSHASFAQLDGGITIDENETVIEESYFRTEELEEPLFSNQASQRTISSLHEASSDDSNYEWSGQLSVVDEIPFSEPQLSRNWIQSQVVEDLKKKNKK